jgi:hypothetical protein
MAIKQPMGVIGPWPDVATARFFLNSLTTPETALPDEELMRLQALDVAALARWLVAKGLGPLAYARYHTAWPALVKRLQGDMYSAVAEAGMWQAKLEDIGPAMAARGLQPALLKGAALALSVYPGTAQRTMSDIDVLLPDEMMETAVQVMVALGYRHYEKGERPLALQEMARGEIPFYDPHGRLVELHWSPFPGWWVQRTTAIDDAAIWQRVEPLYPPFRQLDPEDTVIHVAVHLAVNHHFCASAVRGLLDIAFTADKRPVDWAMVAARAREWRVSVAVYTALELAAQLVGAPGTAGALERLRPSSPRRWLIRRLVTPQGVLVGRDLSRGIYRYLLLLLLTDRLRDMARIVWRTLWPEPEWLAARYGRSVSNWRHLWYLLSQRKI